MIEEREKLVVSDLSWEYEMVYSSAFQVPLMVGVDIVFPPWVKFHGLKIHSYIIANLYIYITCNSLHIVA